MAWLPVCTRQEVSRCHTGGEYEDFVTCRRWRMQARGNNAGFETKSRRHQKYKTGILGAPQKGQMFSKSLKKTNYSRTWFQSTVTEPEEGRFVGSVSVSVGKENADQVELCAFRRGETDPTACGESGGDEISIPLPPGVLAVSLFSKLLEEWEWLVKMLFFKRDNTRRNSTISLE